MWSAGPRNFREAWGWLGKPGQAGEGMWAEESLQHVKQVNPRADVYVRSLLGQQISGVRTTLVPVSSSEK